MEPSKRHRNFEENSPKKLINNEKKLKLSPIEKIVDNIYIDGLFDEYIFDEINTKVGDENLQANSQNTEKIINDNQWHRLKVKAYETDLKNNDLKTVLYNEKNLSEITCRLQGPWSQTMLNQNDIVSVFPVWSNNYKCYVVNDIEGFIVTNPDNLISGTTVVGSLFCQRKAILQEKFRGIDGSNKIMVIGIIVHELLQNVLQKKVLSEKMIIQLAKEILNSKDIFLTMISCKMNLAEAEEEIMKYVPNILSFLKKYILGQTKEIKMGEFKDTISNIQDIEENVWLPKLGLKGKIDVSVKIHHRKKDSFPKPNSNILPLELKTGRASFSFEHKGQVILYQMMLKELGFDTNSGLLLYLRDDIMKEITATRNEQRDLIILRNEISYYLTNPGISSKVSKLTSVLLPEPINRINACSKCQYSTICTTFLKTDEITKLAEDHPIYSISSNVTKHLTLSHIEYFMLWYEIITLEHEEINKYDKGNTLWLCSPEERMKEGRAIINLHICDLVQPNGKSYIHKFNTEPRTYNLNKGVYDLRLSGFSVGEYVIISTRKRIAVATGNIYNISTTSIAVTVDRNLNQNYSEESFIIDKYESKSSNIFNYTNIGLILENTEHHSVLRSIIIDKNQPTYAKKLPAILIREGKSILEELNNIQQCAVLKALSTDSYILIKGLPGTGKTQTLIAIVRLLHLLQKSVLITSHTHSAVDNVLLRLKRHGVPFLRLGSETRIHPELIEHSEAALIQNCTNPEELERSYRSFSIVGVTCLGTSHAYFSDESSFDICIVDESTQVHQPTIIRPLLFAKQFILVGDPDQLAPLIRSNKARQLGGDESLFQRLDSSTATIVLTLQYRMNRVITKLANKLTYKDKLQCGNDCVMKAGLTFSKEAFLITKYAKQKWILKALEKHVDQSVIFLDTTNCQQLSLANLKKLEMNVEKKFLFKEICEENDKQSEQKCVNYCEAAIVFILIEAFILGGYKGHNIGIIAPYRAQVEFLRDIMKEYEKRNDFNGVEVNTVDQYQGRDKEIIIYSCTKTGCYTETMHSKINKNEILEDRRRLTVAITRSKHKLIIIGDQKALLLYTPFHDLLNEVPSRCKHILEEGKLGFSWAEVLAKLNVLLSVR